MFKHLLLGKVEANRKINVGNLEEVLRIRSIANRVLPALRVRFMHFLQKQLRDIINFILTRLNEQNETSLHVRAGLKFSSRRT